MWRELGKSVSPGMLPCTVSQSGRSSLIFGWSALDDPSTLRFHGQLCTVPTRHNCTLQAVGPWRPLLYSSKHNYRSRYATDLYLLKIQPCSLLQPLGPCDPMKIDRATSSLTRLLAITQ